MLKVEAPGRSPTDPYSFRHKMLRLLWRFTWVVLAAWTPPAAVTWRRWLLVRFGATMAKGSDVRGGARVWFPANLVMEENTIIAQGVNCYNQGPVIVRAGAVVSQDTTLCAGTHDIDREDFVHRALTIEIGPSAWIAAEAFVGPGVTIGRRAVLGARGVAFRNLEAETVYVGNPAQAIRKRAVDMGAHE